MKNFVSYLRVSTSKQSASGLGLEAQRKSVSDFLKSTNGVHIAEFVEVESGRKTDAQRPTLKEALALAKRTHSTLLVAKLDRLARNVHFISGLMQAKVRLLALDIPEANELSIHIMSAFAEHESKRISQRTKDALAQAKLQGRKLGTAGPLNLKLCLKARTAKADTFRASIQATLDRLVKTGMTQREIADALNEMKCRTPSGRGSWSQTQVQRLLSSEK